MITKLYYGNQRSLIYKTQSILEPHYIILLNTCFIVFAIGLNNYYAQVTATIYTMNVNIKTGN